MWPQVCLCSGSAVTESASPDVAFAHGVVGKCREQTLHSLSSAIVVSRANGCSVYPWFCFLAMLTCACSPRRCARAISSMEQLARPRHNSECEQHSRHLRIAQKLIHGRRVSPESDCKNANFAERLQFRAVLCNRLVQLRGRMQG